VDAKTVLWIALLIGGIVGGILTHLNKLRFVPKKDFDDHKRECPATICTKIDAVKTTVNGLNDTLVDNAKEAQKRRDEDKTELNKNLRDIAKFIGGVEQFMQKNNVGKP
jgi:DNA-binding FrmR family transcriptional regulator